MGEDGRRWQALPRRSATASLQDPRLLVGAVNLPHRRGIGGSIRRLCGRVRRTIPLRSVG